jgi:formyl-CoA transferase
MRIEIDHPVEGKVPNIGFAVKMMGTPQQVRRPPPLLGEHTREVLEELGITLPATRPPVPEAEPQPADAK